MSILSNTLKKNFVKKFPHKSKHKAFSRPLSKKTNRYKRKHPTAAMSLALERPFSIHSELDDASWKGSISCHVMSCHVMSCGACWKGGMSCHVMSCEVMSCDALWKGSMSPTPARLAVLVESVIFVAKTFRTGRQIPAIMLTTAVTVSAHAWEKENRSNN